MNLGVSTSILGKQQLTADDVAMFAVAGIEIVELVGTGLGVDFEPLDRHYLAAIKNALGDHNIRVHSLHCSCGTPTVYGDPASTDETIRRRAVDSAKRDLEYVTFFGAGYLVVHPAIAGFADWGEKPDHMRASRQSLTAMATACDAAGAKLAVEILAPKGPRVGIYYQDLLALIDGLDPAVVGICLDTNHANLSNDLIEIIHAFGDRIITTHISDNDGAREQHWLPTEGVINWTAAITAFTEVGYDGVLMYELRQPPDVTVRLAEIVANYGTILSGVAGSACVHIGGDRDIIAGNSVT